MKVEKESGVESIEVDADLCDGFGFCVMTAPGVFGMDDLRNVATILAIPAESADIDKARSAALACPARAITLKGRPQV